MKEGDHSSKVRFWTKIALLFIAATIAFYLLTYHGAHLLAYSTYIFFVFFILLHVFMHRHHGMHGRHAEKGASEHEHGQEKKL